MLFPEMERSGGICGARERLGKRSRKASPGSSQRRRSDAHRPRGAADPPGNPPVEMLQAETGDSGETPLQGSLGDFPAPGVTSASVFRDGHNLFFIVFSRVTSNYNVTANIHTAA